MESIGTWWMWAGFAAFVVVATVVDLLVLQRNGSARVTMGQALGWSAVWVSLALVFNGILWWYLDGVSGREVANDKAMEFLTGYIIEKSLAVDNIFVFLMLFTYFSVPAELQRRVLILGVVGAIILRAVMILIGAWLITHFHWILYFFGLFLLFTGVKMMMSHGAAYDLEANPALKWMRGHLRITKEFHGDNFSIMKDGVRWFTPLFAVLVLIGVIDVVFAVDSIPAIFAITEDPFIVLTSNVFAVLGLRAMYFLLAEFAAKFHLLTYGLSIVLMFIGIKMLIVDFYKIPITWSLSFVGIVLTLTVVASLVFPAKPEPAEATGGGPGTAG